ncbi:MAG: hypothetical protein LBS90_07605 [Oscillospiraceae bacterium]|nr:hypothetical protein [Oscillospiraceae bacterium]
MTAVIVIVCVLAALAAIAFLRVGVEAAAEDGRVSATARVGFVKIRLYPRKPGLKPRRVKSAKRARKPKPRTDKPKRKPDIPYLVSEGVKLLATLRRRLIIKRLRIWYAGAGGDDAAAAALAYGGLSAIFGLSEVALEAAFRVREYDLRAGVDYLAAKPSYRAEADISVAVWEVIALGAGALRLLLRGMKKPRGGE